MPQYGTFWFEFFESQTRILDDLGSLPTYTTADRGKEIRVGDKQYYGGAYGWELRGQSEAVENVDFVIYTDEATIPTTLSEVTIDGETYYQYVYDLTAWEDAGDEYYDYKFADGMPLVFRQNGFAYTGATVDLPGSTIESDRGFAIYFTEQPSANITILILAKMQRASGTARVTGDVDEGIASGLALGWDTIGGMLR